MHDCLVAAGACPESAKRRTGRRGRALLGVLLIGLPCASAAAQLDAAPPDGQSPEMCTQNLLPNGSFEEGMDGWRVANGRQDYVLIDRQVARTGEASLCVKATDGPGYVQLSGLRASVSPWEPYRLHFFCRSDPAHCGPWFRIYPIETNGHQTPGRAYWLGCDGGEDWAGYYADFVFPPDVGEAYITFCAGHWHEGAERPGTFWIDDIEFGPAKPFETPPETNISEESIIFNGGFELGHGGQAFGWPTAFLVEGAQFWSGFGGVKQYDCPEMTVTWDGEDAYGGDRCLCVEYTGQDPRHKMLVVQTLWPEEGQEYDIRFFGKSESGDARLAFEPYGKENQWLFTACGTRIRPGDWHEYRLKYVPEERTPVPCGLKMSIVLNGPGKMWIDELEMVRADVGLGPPEEPRPARAEARPPAPAQVADQHCQRGKQLKDERRYAEAAEALREAIEADPNHVEAHWVLGWVLVELKDTDGAAKEFRKVIELAPGSDRAREAQRALERIAR